MSTPELHSDAYAKHISTALEWDDMILDDTTVMQLDEIKRYLKVGKSLFEDYSFGKKIKPGYRALFTGASGTGKTLAATLLGKSSGQDVYKVNLSRVVGKFIGETEKNLLRIFDKAEDKGWILFFDEADSLFGKRTSVKTAHERYANMEVSYILQRIEDFNGLIILSTNNKTAIDEAFVRRFQRVLDFKVPDAHLRHKLWKKLITSEFEYDKTIDLKALAEAYELTPGAMVNSLNYCMLKCLDRKDAIVRSDDLMTHIRAELKTQGKSL